MFQMNRILLCVMIGCILFSSNVYSFEDKVSFEEYPFLCFFENLLEEVITGFGIIIIPENGGIAGGSGEPQDEGSFEICDNEIDDDGDLDIDCEDYDCVNDPNCIQGYCGDGIKNGLEECDFGENPDSCGPGMICNNNCICIDDIPGGPPSGGYCGDGIKDLDEDCDWPDLNGMGCSDFPSYSSGNLDCYKEGHANECEFNFDFCTYSNNGICGDGILGNSPGEECDDNNNIDGDGCDSDCKIEDLPVGDNEEPDGGTNTEDGYCGDGVDNDEDGLIDCWDDDCIDDYYCIVYDVLEDCYNGADDDEDGLIDCWDDDCITSDNCVISDDEYIPGENILYLTPEQIVYVKGIILEINSIGEEIRKRLDKLMKSKNVKENPSLLNDLKLRKYHLGMWLGVISGLTEEIDKGELDVQKLRNVIKKIKSMLSEERNNTILTFEKMQKI
jgi:cysteine-rich repeat protein